VLAAKNPALFVNRLLATLPGKDHRQVLANCEPVELHLAEVISESGERVVVMTKKPSPWRGPDPRQGTGVVTGILQISYARGTFDFVASV